MTEETVQGAAQPTADKPSAEKSADTRGTRKERIGFVVKAAMQKTVVITVERRVRHPKYHKFVTRTSKFVAHDELGCAAGDQVRIQETRPLSKTKRWRVVEKLSV
ncbi:MAG: 30S ribosomal protein S17 [Deltaproteobacteria bacterium]|nr:30S ribosomal protein S17 [Deltaproteobacteria bacterium]